MFPFFDPPQNIFNRPVLSEQQDVGSPPPPPPPPPFKLHPSSLYPFSPPIFDQDMLHDLFLTSHLLPTSTSAPPPMPPPPPPPPPPPRLLPLEPSTNKRTTVRPAKRCINGGNGRKRAFRKDRHSKIYTAQGPRDRRMRLSVDVARKFFDLQDVLGLDKASKTVEWLLTQSKAAMEELTGYSPPPPPRDGSNSGGFSKSESSASDGEVVSVSPPPKAKRRAVAPRRSSSRRAAASHPKLAKDSRAMARARARERTREKKVSGDQANRLVPSFSSFEITGEESGTHDMKSSLEFVSEVDRPGSCSPDWYKPLPMTLVSDESGQISIFDYFRNGDGDDSASLFQERWESPESGNFGQDQQILLGDDVQFQARGWEGLGNPSCRI